MVVGPATAASDGSAQRGVAGHAGHQRAIVGDVTDDGTRCSAVTQLQRATGIDGGAAGVGVGSGQGFSAGTDLGQATGTGDRTAEGAIGRPTHLDRIGAEVDRAVADQGAELLRAVARREVQRGAGGEVDRAGCRQAGIGTQRQRTGVDVGATGVGVGAVQGQRRAALLGQAARTGQNAIEGQCVGTEHGQPGIERDVVGQRGQPGGVQRRRTADSERTGTQRGVVAQHQAAGIECHATTEGVGAGQGLYACTHLHQAAAATDHATEGGVAGGAEGQRIAPQRQRGSTHAIERADGLAAARTGDIESGTGVAQGDIPRRGKAAAQAQCQRAVIDGGTAGIGVGSGQRQRGGTVLDQAAVARHDAAQGDVIAAAQRQLRAVAEVHCIGQVHRHRVVQRGGASNRQRPGSQRPRVAKNQATGIQCDTAAEVRRCHR
ncbi:hypothetical protein G6F59_012944 [Rhizopus arrhizus]|nr:hypothetical protein G6F59_012944 [Rhizopus arrhizus]